MTGGGDGSAYYGTLGRQPKAFLRAHLPNQTRTSVEVVAGLRLRDALLKPLRRRDLDCDACVVLTRPCDGEPIDWDTDISTLAVDEVYVRVLGDTSDGDFESFVAGGRRSAGTGSDYRASPFGGGGGARGFGPPAGGVMKSIGHQFIRKTFFSLAFCECCRRLLFTGLYCNQCNYRFHQRCGKDVPTECNQINMGPCRGYEKSSGVGRIIKMQAANAAHSSTETSAGILNAGGDALNFGR